ncbi:GDSL-type esterase/lipase family protein [Bacillus marinisedimentorum]|uniref:GDSL-type esterase/lipase family protein n=1 Tax=Bacillus marinisedimentorum TaxID=1821260 RepID=UPI000872FFE5|nr:GDSL-type esterase/lipase family protein [Bacillus marinisedimentorum]
MKTSSKIVLVLSLLFNLAIVSGVGVYVKNNGSAGVRATISELLNGQAEIHAQADSYVPNSHHLNRSSTFDIMPPEENAIVFLGDSITQRNEWAELFQHSSIKNRGIDSDRTYSIVHRLNPVIKAKPDKVFIMVGINDLREGRKVADITADYDMILSRLNNGTPDTEIFIQSVLPVNNTTFYKRTDNRYVRALNVALNDLSDKYSAVFINLYPQFLAPSGKELNPDFTYDGLHLNGEGYLLWKHMIEEYVTDERTAG